VAAVRTSADELQARTEPDLSLPPLEQLTRALDAYLGYVENNARGYSTVLRGGIGSDTEVRAILDETRQKMMDRILASMPLDGEPSPRIRLTVRGWVGFVEGASLEWVETRGLSRAELRDLCVRALLASLQVATDGGD
jgi:AcrR family transcriptional regulator